MYIIMCTSIMISYYIILLYLYNTIFLYSYSYYYYTYIARVGSCCRYRRLHCIISLYVYIAELAAATRISKKCAYAIYIIYI